eukprot:763925-Hanusia_phi.AAC.2
MLSDRIQISLSLGVGPGLCPLPDRSHAAPDDSDGLWVTYLAKTPQAKRGRVFLRLLRGSLAST